MIMVVAPACAVILGFIAALLASIANLRSSRADAEKAWGALQVERESLRSLAQQSPTIQNRVRMASHCVDSESQIDAAAADDAMVTEMAPWLEGNHAAQKQFNRINEQLGDKRRLYNSAATIYNNACVTFPAILVAKRLGYTKLGPYEPTVAAGAATDREKATQFNLSDDSKVMNAYMLWAVAWGGSTDIEESAQKATS